MLGGRPAPQVDALRALDGAVLPAGELLPAAGDWAAPFRARLEEARIEWFANRVRRGEAVVGELESAVAANPYQERLWELLIAALYQAGRQADALAAFQRVRVLLADDLGLEPGPRLKELERQVLDQRSGSRARAGTCRRWRLGARRARRGGRAALRTLLEQHRLVEILGPGGVGKTALAIATGRGPPAGLAGPARSRADRGRGARCGDRGAEGHRRRGRPARAPPGDPAVLILDNCEHVSTRPPSWPSGCSTRDRAADPCYEPGRAGARGRPSSSSGRSRSTRGRAVHPPRHAAGDDGETSCAARWTACRWRSSSPPPARERSRSRRSPAGSTIASRVERPGEPQAGAPPRAAGDDRLELRAAVPGRQARPVGAGHVRRRRVAPRRGIGARGAGSAARRRSTSSAGSRAARW